MKDIIKNHYHFFIFIASLFTILITLPFYLIIHEFGHFLFNALSGGHFVSFSIGFDRVSITTYSPNVIVQLITLCGGSITSIIISLIIALIRKNAWTLMILLSILVSEGLYMSLGAYIPNGDWNKISMILNIEPIFFSIIFIPFILIGLIGIFYNMIEEFDKLAIKTIRFKYELDSKLG